MFAKVVGIAASRTPSGSTSHTVNIPSFVEAGDILVAFFSADGVGSVTFPGGWTEAVDTTQGGEIRGVTAWIRADGTEGWGDTGNTISVSTGGSVQSSTIMLRVRGGHATTAPAFALSGDSVSNPDGPSLNPSDWDVEDTLFLSGILYNDSSHPILTFPSGWGIKSFVRSSADASSCGVGVVGLPSAAASADPGTWTFLVAKHAVMATVAIRPASADAEPDRGAFPDIATATSFEATPTTSHVVALPDNLEVGDILVILFSTTGGGEISQTSPFMELRTSVQDSHVSQAWWRHIDGSEGWGDTGNTVTITTSVDQRSSTIAFRVRGTALPFEWDGSGQTTPNPNPPSIDPPFWGTEDAAWLAYTGWDNGTFTLSSYPSSFGDNQTTTRTSTSPGNGAALATREQTASSQDPGTFTISNNANLHAYTFGFLPAIIEEPTHQRTVLSLVESGTIT